MVAASKTVRPLVKAPACQECPIGQLHPHPHNPRGPIEPDSVQELLGQERRRDRRTMPAHLLTIANLFAPVEDIC